MKAQSLLSGMLLLVAVIAGVPTARAEVKSPWLSSDRTVDCTSFETIIRDLKIADMKSDEEKALAMYYFFRQRVFHNLNTTESRDVVKNLSCLGYTLCGSQATCMRALLGSIGIKTRIRSQPGHTYYDAFYNGKYHGFDTFANFYIYTRGKDRNVASFEELIADPTLISDAVKEGRACTNMCPCGDDPVSFLKTHIENDYKPLDMKYNPRNFMLRAGEEIVRSWWTDGKGIKGLYSSKYGPVPLHTCGSQDRKAEPFLFKYWEPYGIPGLGGKSMSYRHTTSGQINYAPDLTNPKFLEGMEATGIARASGGLAGKGELVIPVSSPYYISSGVLVLEVTCPGEGDAVTVSLATEKGKWGAAALTAREAGMKQYKARFDGSLSDNIRHQYWVKIAIDGKAVVNHIYLRTGFMHNAQALPNLMPGDNKLTFEVANPEALKETPVTLVYRYRDAPKWSEEKRIEKTITKSPFVFEAKLPDTGDKLPQMLDMTWTCGKLAWTPGGAAQDRVLADFSNPEAVKKWVTQKVIALSHDGKGMLMDAGKDANNAQVSMEVEENWANFKTLVLDFENLGAADQRLVFRARSDKDNKERTDIEIMASKGKSSARIPITALNKTKINAINKIYLLFIGVPETGSKIRVNKITLEEDRDL